MTKAETGKRGYFGRFGRGKSGWQGFAGFPAQGGREGQKTGRGGLTGLFLAKGRAALPYPRCYSILGLFQMHQALQLHQLHQGMCREKKKYPFFSFLLMKGLVQGGGVGYSCTKCYNCTICTKMVVEERKYPLFPNIIKKGNWCELHQLLQMHQVESGQ